MLSRLDRSIVATGLFFALAAASTGASAAQPPVGTGEVLAPIGAQASYCAGKADCNGGFPEGVAVAGDRVFVAGPATFGTAGKSASVVTVLNRHNGHTITEIAIDGEDLTQEHALSGVVVDGDDNVYVLSTQLGVIRLEREHICHHHHHHHWHHQGPEYSQEIYASPLPIVNGCVPSAQGPCSIPNEAAFDDDGNLYVTDSIQGAIFRIPAGGGDPELWFQSPELVASPFAPLPFGANGIKISPDRQWVYVVDTFDSVDPTAGNLYRIPLVDAPAEEDMELVHTFGAFDVPDSLVFAESGKLYVSLAGFAPAGVGPAIAVLDVDGAPVGEIDEVVGSQIPLDMPATMAFDGHKKSILVANHALFSNPSLVGFENHFAVLRVHVGERGDELPAPFID